VGGGATATSLFPGHNFAAIIADMTDNGILVEIYTNARRQITHIAVIQTDLQEVLLVNKSNGTANLGNLSTTPTALLAGDQLIIRQSTDEDLFDVIKDLSREDRILVRIGFTPAKGDFICEILIPETLKGPITNNTINAANVRTSVTVDGTRYDLANAMSRHPDTEPNAGVGRFNSELVLDQYGYVVEIDGIGSATSEYFWLVEEYDGVDADGRLRPMFKGVRVDGTEFTARHDGSADGLSNVLMRTVRIASNEHELEAVPVIAGVDALPNDAAAGQAIAFNATSTGLITAGISSSDRSVNPNMTVTGARNFFATSVNFIYIQSNANRTVTVQTGVQRVPSTAWFGEAVAVVETVGGNPVVVAVFFPATNPQSTGTLENLYFIPRQAGTSNIGGTNYQTFATWLNGESKGNLTVRNWASPAQPESHRFFTLSSESTTGIFEFNLFDGTGSTTPGLATISSISGNTVRMSNDHEIVITGDTRWVDTRTQGQQTAQATSIAYSISGLQQAHSDTGKNLDIELAYIFDNRDTGTGAVAILYIVRAAVGGPNTLG